MPPAGLAEELSWLADASNDVVQTYSAWSGSLRRRTLGILALIAALDMVLLIAGLWTVRRYLAERASAEQSLRESDERFRQLAENIREVFYIRDMENDRMLYVSPAYEEIWGRPVDRIYENPADFLSLVHPDDKERVSSMRDEQLGGKAFNDEYRIVRDDGEVRWIRARSFPVKNASGIVCRVAGIAEDITKRRRAEEALRQSELKHRALIESAADAMLLADQHGNLLDANRKAESLLDRCKSEIMSLNVRDIHPDEDLKRTLRAFEGIISDGTGELIDGQVIRKDGEVVPVDILGSVIEIDGEKIVQGIFRNVSERQNREAERVAEAMRQRDTLVREVHHRIKNNLQGVLGLLRQQAQANPEVRAPLNKAITQLGSVAVVHGLQGKRPDDVVALCDLVSEIIQAARHLTEALVHPELDVAVSEPIRVAAKEAVPLALVVIELVFNAIKHSPSDAVGNIIVHVTEEGAGARIRIVNPARGLPPGFDLSKGVGLGTGFGLVKALLPPDGAALDVFYENGFVTAELLLSEPVLESRTLE